MTRKRQADVAIYAPHATALYIEAGEAPGGAELQSFYLARALAEAGLHVRHIVAPHRMLRSAGGIEIVQLPDHWREHGLARRRALLHALRAADASVYVQRSAGFATALIAAYARVTRRRFLFSMSSDADIVLDGRTAQEAGAGLDAWRVRAEYRLGLRLADAVVTQTQHQHEVARRNFGIVTRTIPSFAPAVVEPADRRPEAFLWVGRLSGVKDPLAYVELARRVSEARFWMVGADRGRERDTLATTVEAAASEIPNLEILPPRPRIDMLRLYERTVALVNTSLLEGFPNTFLEAWRRGVPVLSLRVDPDDVIARRGLGAVAGGSHDELAKAARDTWRGRREIGDVSARVREYVASRHDPTVVGPQWVALVRSLLPP